MASRRLGVATVCHLVRAKQVEGKIDVMDYNKLQSTLLDFSFYNLLLMWPALRLLQFYTSAVGCEFLIAALAFTHHGFLLSTPRRSFSSDYYCPYIEPAGDGCSRQGWYSHAGTSDLYLCLQLLNAKWEKLPVWPASHPFMTLHPVISARRPARRVRAQIARRTDWTARYTVILLMMAYCFSSVALQNRLNNLKRKLRISRKFCSYSNKEKLLSLIEYSNNVRSGTIQRSCMEK